MAATQAHEQAHEDGQAPPFEILQASPVEGPGLLGTLLERRGRQVRIRRRWESAELPTDPSALRALVVLGPASTVSADSELLALTTACLETETPVLGLGGGADALLIAAGAPPAAGEGAPRWTALWGTEEGGEDRLFKGFVDGTVWLSTALPAPALPDERVTLAVDADGTAQALRVGTGYALRFHAGLDAAGAAALLDDPVLRERASEAGVDPDALVAEAERRARFLAAHAQTLLGRWIDEVVGRTEAESPWGRKGPQPVPHPGVWLYPADGAAVSAPAGGASPSER